MTVDELETLYYWYARSPCAPPLHAHILERVRTPCCSTRAQAPRARPAAPYPRPLSSELIS
eukprot:7376073-Prymnesium_polylepis.1